MKYEFDQDDYFYSNSDVADDSDVSTDEEDNIQEAEIKNEIN